MDMLNVTLGDKPLFHQVELNAILQVAKIALRLYEDSTAPAVRGTFILDAQRDKDDAQLQLRFNLPFGPGRFWGDQTGKTTEDYCEEAIDTVLGFEPHGIFGEHETFPTGIYKNGNHELMILKATGGKFFASCADEHGVSTTLLAAIADTLAILGEDDPILAASCWKCSGECAQLNASTYDITSMFQRAKEDPNRHPAVGAWHDWYSGHYSKTHPRLFFE